MYTYEHKMRIRYAETDKMGYCYYGNYAMFYEVARAEALRSHGFTYRQLEETGVMMPVLENYSKYYRPARYDDEITIKLTIKEKPSTRIKYHYELYLENDKLIHVGSTTLVFVSMETGKPCQMPKVLADILNPYFDEV
jgi:acyl-CoA thioester hydrolase